MNNLLNNHSGDKGSQIRAKIFEIFKDINISAKNMKIAEEFFDFSQEMNLELLKGIEFQDLHSWDYAINNKSQAFYNQLQSDIAKEKYIEYSDRYTLFLDAVGGNTIYRMFSYSFSHYCKQSDKLGSYILHAFSRRYDDNVVQAKIAALLAKSTDLYGFDQKLLYIAKKTPKVLFDAAKNCCYGQCANSESKLYALALAYSETDKDNENINHAVRRVLEIAKAADLKDKIIFDFMMSSCFMAINHSEKVEKYIKEKISGIEVDFFTAIVECVPNSYFEENFDKFIEILGTDKSEALVLECIKVAAILAWKIQKGYKVEIFLNYAAVKYTKQFVELMCSTESASIEHYHCHYDENMYNYYENMYKILEKKNPQAISTYNIDFKSDILKFSIQTEQEYSSIAKNEIEKYLSGESDLSVLKPYFGQLFSAFNKCRNNERLINTCMQYNPDFKRRYIAFKTIQYNSVIVYQVRNFYGDQQGKYNSEVVNSLISEKVPAGYRFSLYSCIYDALYSDIQKQNIEDSIAKSMANLSETNDEEYETCCPVGEVFTRKVYVRYLELTNENNKNKDRILDMCTDTSKEVRRVVTEVIFKHKEYENEIIKLLKAKKSTVRETAVDILAMWGADNYKDILLAVADNEKSAKIADKIRNMLTVSITTSTSEDGEGNVFSPTLFVENIHKGGKNRKILWLYETENPIVHFENGTEADDKYMQAIMLCYSSMTTFGVSENANLLAKELKQDELNKFAAEIFSKWISDGAESKKKWVLYFTLIHGGYNMIDVILHYIKEWSENARGAIASEAVKALALNGSSSALMTVDNIAHKFKHKQVKNAALQALDNAAEELGITSDELGDRIVPDLGFNENMERVFDYGARKFKVYLTSSLELEVYDENDKKLKTIPAPSKKDNEEIAKQSNTEFKQMKKQLKNVISIQKLRLETALLADRRWDKEAWNNLFVKNPVMHSFAIGLIWSAYKDDKLVQTFRYMEDGSFNTSDEDEYTLPDNCTIGLVHPIDLDDDTLSTWKEQLSDYEIVQPIEQLERKVYRINDDEIGTFDINRFKGRKLNDLTLLGRMTKLGWSKGSVQDAGGFNTFYREDIVKRIKNDDGTVRLIGNAAEFNFSGMYVGGMGEEVDVENVRFYIPGTITRGSYVYDKADDNKAIKLEKINPRYFSEIVNQLETILKGTEETD